MANLKRWSVGLEIYLCYFYFLALTLAPSLSTTLFQEQILHLTASQVRKYTLGVIVRIIANSNIFNGVGIQLIQMLIVKLGVNKTVDPTWRIDIHFQETNGLIL